MTRYRIMQLDDKFWIEHFTSKEEWAKFGYTNYPTLQMVIDELNNIKFPHN